VNIRQIYYWIAAVVGILAVFQFFLRYQYEHLAGGIVMRIDRLTATSCYMPCVPPAKAAESPSPTPFDPDAAEASFVHTDEMQNQNAILLAKNTEQGRQVDQQYPNNGYSWTAATTDSLGRGYDVDIARHKNPFSGDSFADLDIRPDTGAASFQTKLVCYCNDVKGVGWNWEVHTDSGSVYFVDDNADLMKKYFPTRSGNPLLDGIQQ
jgi:hypothetical protein